MDLLHLLRADGSLLWSDAHRASGEENEDRALQRIYLSGTAGRGGGECDLRYQLQWWCDKEHLHCRSDFLSEYDGRSEG